jgi:hypothetical protein
MLFTMNLETINSLMPWVGDAMALAGLAVASRTALRVSPCGPLQGLIAY